MASKAVVHVVPDPSGARLVHVFPLGDPFGKVEHDTSGGKCWCEPTRRPDGVIVHQRAQ